MKMSVISRKDFFIPFDLVRARCWIAKIQSYPSPRSTLKKRIMKDDEGIFINIPKVFYYLRTGY